MAGASSSGIHESSAKGARVKCCCWHKIQSQFCIHDDRSTDPQGTKKSCYQRSAAALQVERTEETPTLIVTREIEEHANVFHSMTDLLNVFVTLRMLQWDWRAPRQIILLDSHPQGPLDGLWPAVAAGGGPSFLNGPTHALSSGMELLPLLRHACMKGLPRGRPARGRGGGGGGGGGSSVDPQMLCCQVKANSPFTAGHL